MRGEVHSVAFVIPWGAVWSLPAYELALLTSARTFKTARVEGVELTLVTPEAEPLQLFGSPASEAARALLDENGVEIQVGAYAGKFADGELELIPDGSLRPIASWRFRDFRALRSTGFPKRSTASFLSTRTAASTEYSDVFAAGDITSFTREARRNRRAAGRRGGRRR